MARGWRDVSFIILLFAGLACDREHEKALSPAATSDLKRPAVAPGLRVDFGEGFDEAFRRGGPVRASGYLPLVGDRVLAHFVDVSWYTATVLEVSAAKRKARVRWAAGTGEDRDLPLSAIAPLETGVDRPGWALARPDGPGPWLPVRVLSTSRGAAEVLDRSRRVRTVAVADLVAVGP